MMGRLAYVLSVCALFPLGSLAAPITFIGAGGSAAGARDAFRAAVGGGLVAGANGSFGGARREINWDGVPDTMADPNALPANFFNVNSPRGVVFATPGTGFRVSANVGIAPPLFATINPTYAGTFVAFSPQRLFTAIGSTITDVNFFVPGTGTAATTNAFGAFFTDVDVPGATTIQFFDGGGASLGTFAVPPASNSLSFLGVLFTAGERVGRVRISSGNTPLGPVDGGPVDVVVMDDFIYGEPAPLATCALTCPADIVVDADAGSCGAVVNYPAPTIGGSCGTVISSPASGTLFPIGVTTVTVTSTAGPSCSFTVTVNDTQPPAMSCPASFSVAPTSLAGAVVNYTTPSATDNCPGAIVSCDIPSGTLLAMGPHLITCTATDAVALTSSCSFTATVGNAADLSITKSATPLVVGGDGSYTLVVTNNGPAPATAVIVTDPLPTTVTATGVTATQGSCSGTTTISCNVGTLAVGASATITIAVQATTLGPVTNTATVTAAETDLVPGDNAATTAGTVGAAVPALSPGALLLLALLVAAVGVTRLR